jgi:hypothetical protein
LIFLFTKLFSNALEILLQNNIIYSFNILRFTAAANTAAVTAVTAAVYFSA